MMATVGQSPGSSTLAVYRNHLLGRGATGPLERWDTGSIPGPAQWVHGAAIAVAAVEVVTAAWI